MVSSGKARAEGRLHREVGAAAALLTGGGVPAWLGDGGRAEELREDVRKVVVHSILA